MKKTDALIIGAGPTGLFTAHQLKLIGLDCEIVDNLDKLEVNASNFILISQFTIYPLYPNVQEKNLLIIC